MFRLVGSLICLVTLGAGCTSHSSLQITRQYIASYDEVFRRIPIEAKKCSMTLKKSDQAAGTIVLNANRTMDKILTSSLLNMFAGDEVIVKVQRLDPLTTSIWIDSKARGQIGMDLGRTKRNVSSLANVLDSVWAQADSTTERGAKRTSD